MKKRPGVKGLTPEPVVQAAVVPPDMLEAAKKAVFEEKTRKTYRCRVCGAEGATEQSEMLCWVCRRLKISAWRDVEQQAPMSE